MNRYLTTPIYYASGAPHLGHAYTTLVADCYQRYYQLRGDDVRLVTGTDEHGQKIERIAAETGTSPRQLVDARSAEFRHLWASLGIQVDRFQRTTDALHQQVVLQLWRRLMDAGDLYRGRYEGLYCVGCEQYFTEGDVCPVHRKPLEQFSEVCWFFRLSRYADALIEHIESHPEFILPVARRNEVLAFLRASPLRDLSVSRTSTAWGIPVPEDVGHVLYVWIDALTTYLSALCDDGDVDLDDPRVLAWWREATHFIGKDILTFHAVYWPAILLSARLPLPRRLIVNGWLTVEGRKIAKSDPGTIVDPLDLTDQVGRDGLRHYFLRAVSLGQDVDFHRDHLVRVVNADLANNLGNLVSRFVALSQKCFGGEWQHDTPLIEADRDLLNLVSAAAESYPSGFNAGNPAQSARLFVDAAAAVNRYTQQQAPWQLADKARVATVLWTIHQALADLTILAAPFVPETAAAIRTVLRLPAADWALLGTRPAAVRTQPTQPVYRRVGESLI